MVPSQNVAPSSVVLPREFIVLQSMICPIVCLTLCQELYADDTYLSYSNGNIYSVQSSLNEDLLNINRWLTANKLMLNLTKTEFMLIGSFKAKA